MIPIGFVLGWLGYAVGFYGHALIKGYNISFSQVVNPFNPYTGTWPPPIAVNTVIFPDGKPDDNGSGGTGPTPGPPGNQSVHEGPKAKNGKCPPGLHLDPNTGKCFAVNMVPPR